MFKVTGIYVKFIKTIHQIWSCYVTLASNSENFYFLPNSVSRDWSLFMARGGTKEKLFF